MLIAKNCVVTVNPCPRTTGPCGPWKDSALSGRRNPPHARSRDPVLERHHLTGSQRRDHLPQVEATEGRDVLYEDGLPGGRVTARHKC